MCAMTSTRGESDAPGKRADEISETVGVEVGQEVLPLAPQDVAHRTLESGDAVRVRQLLEEPLGLVGLREDRSENAASTERAAS